MQTFAKYAKHLLVIAKYTKVTEKSRECHNHKPQPIPDTKRKRKRTEIDVCKINKQMSQLMRLWYLSHRRPAKAQASLRIRAVSPEPSLFARMKYGSRRRVRPKMRHLAPLDDCPCTFEELSLRRTKSAIIS